MASSYGSADDSGGGGTGRNDDTAPLLSFPGAASWSSAPSAGAGLPPLHSVASTDSNTTSGAAGIIRQSSNSSADVVSDTQSLGSRSSGGGGGGGRPPSGRSNGASGSGNGSGEAGTAVPYGDEIAVADGHSLARGTGATDWHPRSSGLRSGHRNQSEVTLKAGGSRRMAPHHVGDRSNRRRSGSGGSGGSSGSGSDGRGTPFKHLKRRQNGIGSSHQANTPFSNLNQYDNSRQEEKRTCMVFTAIGFCVLAIMLGAKTIVWPAPHSRPGESLPTGNASGPSEFKKQLHPPFDDRGRFKLEDFDAQSPFSNFLPGVAGIYGKPVWAFYTNRGQCIASFGTKSKDYPIMEFNAANKAYQNTAMLGFRTFLRITRSGHTVDTEPFSPLQTSYDASQGTGPNQNGFETQPKRVMYVGPNEMQIRETDIANKIETNVTYFTLPEEDFGSFVRRTTISNLALNEPVTISVLDGLARMEPAGGEIDGMLKKTGRTLEGFFGVYQASMRDDIRTMPFYRMSTEAIDNAAIKVQEKGHYVLSFIEGDQAELLPIVYDASAVFGQDTMFLRPIGFHSKSVSEIVHGPQYGHAKTSSAFAAVDEVTIPPGGNITIASFYGKANDIFDVPVIARRVMAPGFVQYKFSRAIELVNQITQSVETRTGDRMFNGHVQQMFLDNSLRGGISIILGVKDDMNRMTNADEDKRMKVYHLFSRVHGDLERDYNDFQVEPTYFSNGPGNFRDVAQNRRNDVFFTPAIGSFDVKMFLSFIQADGYQPNVVEANIFAIDDKATCNRLAMEAVGHADGHRAQRESLSGILCNGPFRPGQLFELIEELNIALIMDRQLFIDATLAVASSKPMAVFKDGFWADHWTYYMDLIQAYVAVYPDKEEALMYDHQLSYFFSPASVRPRANKYVLSQMFEGKGQHVRQLKATNLDGEKEQERQKYFNEATGWYDAAANWQHDKDGREFSSAPIEKLFLLATLKFATRDPYGMGIEYEAGKPGWNDAMNGLPGMVGSGMPETYELEVMLKYIRSVVARYERSMSIPVELGVLLEEIASALETLGKSGYTDDGKLSADVPAGLFEYWDTVATAREKYREATKITFSGKIQTLTPNTAGDYLDKWMEQVQAGKARAIDIGRGESGQDGIAPTYFAFNVTEWTNAAGKSDEHHNLVLPLAMRVMNFPMFLEGPTRVMKTLERRSDAKAIYELVRQSALRDNTLNMYTVSASLKGQSFDMGRMMAFTPGWLENESVWLHMSYKFYLELLRAGLYRQFFDEMSSGMLPFISSDQYGRSPMECSSFIASSAFEDPSVRGRGFLARLSGATAEFLSMWVLMMIGPSPFSLDGDTKQLQMRLAPTLPMAFFDGTVGTNNPDLIRQRRDEKIEEGAPVPTISFKLFSSIIVTYHNPEMRDLLGEPPKRYEVGLRDGSREEIDGPTIPSDLAVKIRRVVFVDTIDAYF